MTVGPLKCFNRHAEKAGSGPHGDAALHEPCSRRVTQNMRADAFQFRPATRRSEAFLDVSNRFPVNMKYRAVFRSETPCAAQMRKQTRRNP